MGSETSLPATTFVESEEMGGRVIVNNQAEVKEGRARCVYVLGGRDLTCASRASPPQAFGSSC